MPEMDSNSCIHYNVTVTEVQKNLVTSWPREKTIGFYLHPGGVLILPGKTTLSEGRHG
jgi:hypothetical protein